jgi:hypothetical protein
MAQSWKKLMVVGVLAVAGLGVGCTERQERDTNRAGNEVESTVDEAAKDVGAGINRGAEEIDEGIGGAGNDDNDQVDIGNEPGVIKDGEGPLEDPDTRPGKNPGVINDGEGPLEGNHNDKH